MSCGVNKSKRPAVCVTLNWEEGAACCCSFRRMALLQWDVFQLAFYHSAPVLHKHCSELFIMLLYSVKTL